MRLRDLLHGIPVRRIIGDLDVEISHLTRDSREVGAGSIFVAIKGANVDGHALVSGLGAATVVVEQPVEAAQGVTVVEVQDTHAALPRLAAALHGHPGASVSVVGVTGTNGKTTTTTLLAEAGRRLGLNVGRIGTLGAFIGDDEVVTGFTTPEAPQLQGLLACMRDAQVSLVAMEVSSIGLALRRVDGIPFALAVFTSFSRDHLDFHQTMEAYLAAKERLFTELLGEPRVNGPRALVCADDPATATLRLPPDTWRYGEAADADVRMTALTLNGQGCQMTVVTPIGGAQLVSPLLGRHNAQNLCAALGALVALGHAPQVAADAVGAVTAVPGRLERIDNDRGLLVAVDYAHSDDALLVALGVLRELVSGELWVVFGAGGDRDTGKRPRMGEVARRLADRVVVTTDNPRSESPAAIAAEIVAGMSAPPDRVELDRAAAIEWAIHAAKTGDAVLIAGKGHETYQEVGGQRFPFDDREAARAALGAR